MTELAAGSDYVASELRRLDRDRYFASLMLPASIRRDSQALYAFNAEVASIRDRVRDPRAGDIRLQWWSDALQGQDHGAVRQNPLAAALLDVLAKHQLPTVPLLRLLAARRFDLYDDPMPDITSFEGYAGETVSTLYQFVALMLGGRPEGDTADAAGHLGVAHAYVGHLRSFGHNAAQGRIFLPWSVLSANGVTEGEIFSGTLSEGLAEALGQIHDFAGEHLAKAKAAIGKMPPTVRPAFAQMALIERQLRDWTGGGQAFQPSRQQADWQKLFALSLWTWRNSRR
ncbi:phytoene synthase [Devosia enhydra]|uniref:Phytoene synthase n=1 Tax=Devosia enhydra TaxID=665118 RepID=A0A1K2HVF8_9HYPH|nr:phytoene/squalene synthase family protein [Devosia enhydra]SFZ82349.1 phytoene synthase [Devosia enhydra]